MRGDCVTRGFRVDPSVGVAAGVDADDRCRRSGLPQERAAAVQAATDEVRNKRRWPNSTLVAAYPVGATNRGSYAELFAFQVPQCGNAIAEASWVVELTSPTPGPGGSTRQAQDVVAPFSGGWRVWGHYH